MVQIKHLLNQSCEISLKSDLRRSLDAVDNLDASGMGNQESQLRAQIEQAVELKSSIERDLNLLAVDGFKGKRYTPEQILALKQSPLAQIKPSCADDKPFWVGKEYRKS